MNRLTLRGNNHFFVDLHKGNEDAILLVHGHPFDHTMWSYQVDCLQRFRLVIPDLKGYGKTDYQFERIFIEEHALDLVLLLDALRIETVHLIGLSMGGQIIIEFARLFPRRVRSLVICDSNPAGETKTSRSNRLELAQRMLSIGMEEYAKEDIHKYVHPKTMAERAEAYDHLYEMMINTKVEGAAASHMGRAERRDNYNYLQQIKVPTMVIVGENDFFTPVDEMKSIAEQIPNSTFAVVENAGHMPNMEQPDVFNKLLLDFYSQWG